MKSLYVVHYLLPFDAEGLGDALFGALTLVSAVDDVADRGVGDAEASG